MQMNLTPEKTNIIMSLKDCNRLVDATTETDVAIVHDFSVYTGSLAQSKFEEQSFNEIHYGKLQAESRTSSRSHSRKESSHGNNSADQE